jgi:hypothetical protein
MTHDAAETGSERQVSGSEAAEIFHKSLQVSLARESRRQAQFVELIKTLKAWLDAQQPGVQGSGQITIEAEDLAGGLGVSMSELGELLDALVDEGLVLKEPSVAVVDSAEESRLAASI